MPRKLKLSLFIAVPLILTLAGILLTALPDLSARYGDTGPTILVLGALMDAALIIYGLKEGVQNYIMFQDAKFDYETMQNRFRKESLYTNTGHTDGWLQGFASCLEFFTDNYLSGRTIGPTEEIFWQICRQEADGKNARNYNEQSYRQYMLQSVLFNYGITTEEFKKIAGMISKDNVRETLSAILYSKETVQMYVDEQTEALNPSKP